MMSGLGTDTKVTPAQLAASGAARGDRLKLFRSAHRKSPSRAGL